MKKTILVLSSLLILCFSSLNSQVLITGDGSYAQNFDGLLNTGLTNAWTDNTTIANVYSQRSSAGSSYAANNGTSTTGGLYSYGTTATTERALGTIGSANPNTGGSFAHGILLQNTSGFAVSDLKVSYTLEQWRNSGNTTANTITFWYKISSTAITTLTPFLINTGWTSVTILNTNSPINTATAVALNGNLAANRVSVTDIQIPSLSIPEGAYIMLCWYDIDHTGTDHGLAIDDVNLTWTACSTPSTFYRDLDQDGFGSPDDTILACSLPSGYSTDNTDCNDTIAAINPNTTWFLDGDNDMFGDAANSLTSCTEPTSASYVLNSSDCDDNNPNVNAITTWYIDSDNDGFGNLALTTQNCGQPVGYVADSTDCDDTNNQINPNATELFDGVDNNCNLVIDEGFILTTYYEDLDNDGFGGDVVIQSVTNPGSGYVLIGGDCNDNNNQINPNATEILDGVDNNCNLVIDEGFILVTYYEDLDNDGFGGDVSIQSVTNPGPGYVLISGDCNDNNNVINPNATDIPGNGIDEDCSGSDANLAPVVLGIYEFTQPSGCPVTATAVTSQPSTATFSAFSSTGINCQAAGNVYNNNGWNTTAVINLTEFVEFSITANECQSLDLDRIAFNHRCSATGGTPTWYVRSSLDNYATNLGTGLSGNNNNQNLDDTVTLGSSFDAVSNVTFRFFLTGIGTTGATFRFDNVSLFGNAIALPTQTYYADADNDGFGNLAIDSIACITPIGFVLNNTDCNDTDSLINPTTTWFLDGDGDLIGGTAQTFVGCTPPTGYVLSNNDCDDSNINITGSTMYYADADNDTYGDFSTGALYCSNPGAGFVTNSNDCDDTNNAVNPGATEICDGIDNDCVGGIDNGLTFVTYYTDADLDGFGTGTGQSLCSNPGAGFVIIAGDCNDTDDQINPDSPEICDGIDNNCASGIDDGLTFVAYFTDTDDDGFGTGTGQIYCQNPGAGFVTIDGDCNDNNNQVYPGATEIFGNTIDENCDGVDGYVGLIELTNENFKVIPNPNNGSFKIELSKAIADATISVQDLNGKEISSSKFTGNEFALELKNATPGIYFIKIQTENSISMQRMVIK